MIDLKNIPSEPGVYSIINKNNGRRYIGASKNMRSRVAQHLNQLKSCSHDNREMNRDFTICKGKGFHFKCLKSYKNYNKKRLQAKETAIIKSLKRPLYNRTHNSSRIESKDFLSGKEKYIKTVWLLHTNNKTKSRIMSKLVLKFNETSTNILTNKYIWAGYWPEGTLDDIFEIFKSELATQKKKTQKLIEGFNPIN